MTARTRLIAVLAAVAISSTVAACSGGGSEPSPKASATPAAAQPDLAGIPAVVAVVDGTKITRADFTFTYEAQFQQAATAAQSSGQPLDQDALKQQVATTLINTQLLLAEADDRGYTVTQKQRDATLADLATQNGVASSKELLASLADQGLDADAVDAQLEKQVLLDRLAAAEVGDAKITEADLRKVYADVVAQQTGDKSQLPTFDEARPQIEEQVRAENENAAAQRLVEKLRKTAKITINL